MRSNLENKANRYSLHAAVLLAVPLVILPYQSTSVVLADLLALFGAFCFLRMAVTRVSLLLLIAVFFGLISVLYGTLFQDKEIGRQLGSLIFFIKPCFGYFAARNLIRNREALDKFIGGFKAIFSVFISVVFLSLLNLGVGQFRIDGDLNVDLFGLPIAGTYGVNSLASFLACGAFILLFPSFEQKNRFSRRYFFAFMYLVSTLIIFLTLSREAILAAVLMLLAYIVFIRGLMFGGAGLIIIIGLFSVFTFDNPMFEAKFRQLEFGIENLDLDYISSGRLSLYEAAIEGLIKRPFVGVSFAGFSGTEAGLSQYDEYSGLTPHNFFLTAIWKGGVFFGLFYLSFLLHVTRSSFNGSSGLAKSWLISFVLGVLLVLSNLWDVLIVPNIAILYYFLCGAMANSDRA